MGVKVNPPLGWIQTINNIVVRAIEEERGLPQQQILDLLSEAANPACRPIRRISIQAALEDATRGVFQDEKQEGMLLVLGKLYTEISKYRSALFPSFFPAFAVTCSSRDIDWSLWSQNDKLFPRFPLRLKMGDEEIEARLKELEEEQP